MPPLDPEDLEELRAERLLLNKLRLRSFTATPATIVPFEPVTFSWDVSVPAEVATLDGLRFTIQNAVVSATGTRSFTPLSTSAFQLKAHGNVATRTLGQRIVNVSLEDCEQIELTEDQLSAAAQPLMALFTGSTLTARGALSVETSSASVTARLPLAMAIPNFYNADVNVALELRVSARDGRAAVQLSDVRVDVIFHWLEHVGSLGLATALQAAIQPVAASLIKDFLGTQVEESVTTELDNAITVLLGLWQAGDPAGRVYRLYSLSTSDNGLLIVGCPVPASSPPNQPRRMPRRGAGRIRREPRR